MTEKKLYTSRQIGFGGFLGGPLAIAYFLQQNHKARNELDPARNAFFGWVMFSLVLVGVVPWVPDEIPNSVIPAAYAATASAYAVQKKMSKKDILEAGEYGIRSNWKVFGISLLTLTVLLALIFAWMIGLEASGYTLPS